MRSSITRIFILLTLALLCTSAAFASGTEKQVEKKATQPKAAGSATERGEAIGESNEATEANHGSGTERDSTVKTEDTESDGSTSERKAPASQAGSGTERE